MPTTTPRAEAHRAARPPALRADAVPPEAHPTPLQQLLADARTRQQQARISVVAAAALRARSAHD